MSNDLIWWSRRRSGCCNAYSSLQQEATQPLRLQADVGRGADGRKPAQKRSPAESLQLATRDKHEST